MNLKDIAQDLENLAEKAWEEIQEDAVEIADRLVPVIEDGFKLVLEQFGELAIKTVLELMGAAGASLSGSEKANLAATTIVDRAATAGLQILAADVTALVKNAYLAVVSTAPAR